ARRAASSPRSPPRKKRSASRPAEIILPARGERACLRRAPATGYIPWAEVERTSEEGGRHGAPPRPTWHRRPDPGVSWACEGRVAGLREAFRERLRRCP